MLEELAHGFGLLEGPRYASDGCLYFSDGMDGGVYCLAPDGKVSTVVPRRKAVGGIVLHADGGVVISGRDICHVLHGQSRIVFKADAPSINDITVDARGRLLVGVIRGAHISRDNRIPGECVVLQRGEPSRELYRDLLLANGMGFSPDGGTLYHADTGARCVVVHDYDQDRGTVAHRRTILTDAGIVPDGMAVDEDGNLWVADLSGSRAVRVFTPSGQEVHRIAVPAVRPTSLVFGGADRRDLYIVTADNTDAPEKRGTVYRTRVPVAGLAVPATCV
jgi:D-xylonolactonase